MTPEACDAWQESPRERWISADSVRARARAPRLRTRQRLLPFQRSAAEDLATIARFAEWLVHGVRTREARSSATILRVRIARILLLVLLCAWLPVRRVMAAAVLCPTGAGTKGAVHAMHALHGDMHEEAGAGVHQHMAGEMGKGEHHHDGAAGHTGCNLCSVRCSVPPLASAVPGVPLPHALASVSFPDLTAPVPSFLSEGQERPPRSI